MRNSSSMTVVFCNEFLHFIRCLKRHDSFFFRNIADLQGWNTKKKFVRIKRSIMQLLLNVQERNMKSISLSVKRYLLLGVLIFFRLNNKAFVLETLVFVIEVEISTPKLYHFIWIKLWNIFSNIMKNIFSRTPNIFA